jgi:hypothetical protein
MDSRPEDRRIVARRLASGRMRWRPPFTRSWRARRREKHLDATAVVEELSLAGARLVVPRTEGLEVGATAGIEADGYEGVVEIRWIEGHENPALARVGVEHRRLSPELEQHLHDLMAADRKDAVDWRWEIAR